VDRKYKKGLFSIKRPSLALYPGINFCKLDGEIELQPNLFLHCSLGMCHRVLLETIAGLHSCEYLKFIYILQITEPEHNSGQKGGLEVTQSSPCRIVFQVRFNFKFRSGCLGSHHSGF